MGRALKFTKMQGAGNDYVYVNGFTQCVSDPGKLAVKISDRHFGVGSDGLVLLLPSAQADARMRMFNADGSEAEMCGNASRCVGKLLFTSGLVRKDIITLETGAGVKVLHLEIEDGDVTSITVDMGEPILDPGLVPVDMPGLAGRCIAQPLEVDGQTYEVTAVSMGNPHAVLFMENVSGLDLSVLGPFFEHHKSFPNRINTEFVEVLSRTAIRMRVWERGAGETLACGTGACAALVACVLNNLTERQAAVELPGGVLNVKWDKTDNHVYLSGPAVTVFEGEYFL